MHQRRRKLLTALWGALLLFLGTWFFLFPMASTMAHIFTDKGLSSRGSSSTAFKWHRGLSKRYQRYAEDRVKSGVAATIPYRNISGTEWPLFGSVFYLWATVELQKTWETDTTSSATSPKEYAAGAVEAATALVLDPTHATWVKKHWGEDYMNRENVFYRMLVMSAIIAHHELTGSVEHLALLREQTASFSAELDASPHGQLDDYPYQCFPGDVLAALAAIQRADDILATDHSRETARAIRGFEGGLVGPLGLPPYAANALAGRPLDPSRGCSNSYQCTFGPEVWPERATTWYQTYVEHFWQQSALAAGFREFPHGYGDEWYFDVDAGPVINGLGSAASAFGLAAARSNDDYERAYPLAAQMIAASWPLPDGTLLVPRLISDRQHAPHLGEASILFQLSRQPVAGIRAAPGTTRTRLPGSVWLTWLAQLAIGGMLVWRGIVRWKKLRRTWGAAPMQRVRR